MAGESLSVGVCEESGCGGQWLARIRHAVAEGLVPDVSVVPVGISYDCPPSCQFIHQVQINYCRFISFVSFGR